VNTYSNNKDLLDRKLQKQECQDGPEMLT